MMRYTGRRQLSVRAAGRACAASQEPRQSGPVPIDTLRIVVGWNCNLACPYCCNRQDSIRQQFTPVSLDQIDWSAYDTVCITGGEPLLYPKHIAAIAARALPALVVLYTNGTLLVGGETPGHVRASDLCRWGVHALNVGLHDPAEFATIIGRVQTATLNLPLVLRFHVWERYRAEMKRFDYLNLDVRFWQLDQCDRPNERRVVLNESSL